MSAPLFDLARPMRWRIAARVAIDILTALAILAATYVAITLIEKGSLDRALLPYVIVLACAALTPIVEVTNSWRAMMHMPGASPRRRDSHDQT